MKNVFSHCDCAGQLIAHVSWQCPQTNEDVHLSGFKVLVDGKQYGSSMHSGVRTVRLQVCASLLVCLSVPMGCVWLCLCIVYVYVCNGGKVFSCGLNMVYLFVLLVFSLSLPHLFCVSLFFSFISHLPLHFDLVFMLLWVVFLFK